MEKFSRIHITALSMKFCLHVLGGGSAAPSLDPPMDLEF